MTQALDAEFNRNSHLESGVFEALDHGRLTFSVKDPGARDLNIGALASKSG